MSQARQTASGKRPGRLQGGRVCVLGALLVLGLTFGPAHAQDAPPAPTPTGPPGALTQQADYWDMGLRLAFPAEWPAPQFSAGQMLLAAPDAFGAEGALSGPVVALRIVNRPRDLGLAKDVPFEHIAAAISTAATGGQSSAEVVDSGMVRIAGLEAGFVDVLDSEAQQAGQSVAFMLPDGRIGALIGVAPLGIWAEFAPTFSAMQGAARLLDPSSYTPPALASPTAFAPSRVQFRLPAGWTAERIDEGAAMYFDPAQPPYADQSGFANGPLLVMLARPARQGKTLAEALVEVVGEGPNDVVSDGRAGGRLAAQRQSVDTATGQRVTFIALESADGARVNVLRWSVPEALSAVSAPLLDALLASLR